MKKAVFFDGDGTLWYPKTTLRVERPHWVYTDPSIADPIGEFIATPNTAATLRTLGTFGIRRILLSTSPLPETEGIEHRVEISRRLGILGLLDDIRVAPDYMAGKSEQLSVLLQEYKISPADALMVGDNCEWDFMAAQAVGVAAALIASDYERDRAESMGISPIIEDISGILDLLGAQSSTPRYDEAGKY